MKLLKISDIFSISIFVYFPHLLLDIKHFNLNTAKIRNLDTNLIQEAN